MQEHWGSHCWLSDEQCLSSQNFPPPHLIISASPATYKINLQEYYYAQRQITERRFGAGYPLKICAVSLSEKKSSFVQMLAIWQAAQCDWREFMHSP